MALLIARPRHAKSGLRFHIGITEYVIAQKIPISTLGDFGSTIKEKQQQQQQHHPLIITAIFNDVILLASNFYLRDLGTYTLHRNYQNTYYCLLVCKHVNTE